METAMEMEDDLSTPDDWSSGIDISQLCRVCANTNEYLIPIFSGEGIEHDLQGKIRKHLPIKVSEEDKLPTQLCYQCASTLIAWHDLVVTCVEAEDKFKSCDKETTEAQAITESCKAESNVGVQSAAATNPLETGINIVEEQQTVDKIEPVLDNSAVEPGNIIIEGVPSDLRLEYLDKDFNSGDHTDMHSYETSSCEQSKLQERPLSCSDKDEAFSTLYSCNICKQSNMTLEEFLQHSLNSHSIEEKSSPTGKLDSENKTNGESTVEETVVVEGYKLQSRTGSSVTLYTCTICGLGNLMAKNLKQHSLIHPDCWKSNVCNLCHERFDERIELTAHLKMHVDNNDLTCQFCFKKFHFLDDLEQHEGDHVLEEFVCKECHQRFISETSILCHFEKSHSNELNCEICHTSFDTQSSINVHFMTHIRLVKKNEKYFTCETCQKKYDSSISLQRHILCVHNSHLAFTCEICGFIAYQKEAFNEHLALGHKKKEYFELKSRPTNNINSNKQITFEFQYYVGTDSTEKDYSFKSKSVLKEDYLLKSKFVPKEDYLLESKFVPKEDYCLETKSAPKKDYSLKTKSAPKKDYSLKTPKEDYTLKTKSAKKKNNSLKTKPVSTKDATKPVPKEHYTLRTKSVAKDSPARRSVFNCKQCKKSFIAKEYYIKHFNLKHTKNSTKKEIKTSSFPFSCKVCKAVFKLEFELNYHIKEHERLKYQCDVCFRMFKTDRSLQKHIVNNHRPSVTIKNRGVSKSVPSDKFVSEKST